MERTRVLVVDGDGTTRSALAAVLGQAGWEVLAAADARSATSQLLDGEPDVVLCDLELLMSASRAFYEVLLSRDEPRSLLLMSALAYDRPLRSFRCLRKPIVAAELLEAVAAAAPRRRPEPAAG